MSKYMRIETVFKDEATLIQALQDCGIPFERGNALTLYGYQGDARPETAEIVVRRCNIESSANDLGFQKQPDGSFSVIISEYDSGTRRAGLTMLNQTKQRYARLMIERQAALRGLEVKEVKAEGGAIRLQLVPKPKVRGRNQLRVSVRR